MNDSLKNLKQRIDITMMAFAREFPFFGILSERCSFSAVESKNHFCQTACIDKFGNILFNINFCQELSDKQFLTLLAHEVCHFVFEHFGRRQNRNSLIWNCATDYAINLMLSYQFTNKDFHLNDWLLDTKFDDHSAERIYEAIKNKINIKLIITDLSDGNHANSDGEICDGEGITVLRDRRVPLPSKEGKTEEQYESELQDYCRQAIAEGYTSAKSQGLLPAGVERIVVGHLQPKVNWLQALRQKMRLSCSRKASRDVSWSIPNRRFLNSNFIFPTNIGPEQPKIVFAVDTSGSMSSEDLKQGIAELEDIRKKFNAKVYFIDCDSAVYESRWIKPFEALPQLKGGGGTDFEPVFKHIKDKRIKPDYCVFFTDGDGNFGEETPDFNVLWVLTNLQVEPPFGDVVRVAVDNLS
jgi:predicted metal-dependent peptidase